MPTTSVYLEWDLTANTVDHGRRVVLNNPLSKAVSVSLIDWSVSGVPVDGAGFAMSPYYIWKPDGLAGAVRSTSTEIAGTGHVLKLLNATSQKSDNRPIRLDQSNAPFSLHSFNERLTTDAGVRVTTGTLFVHLEVQHLD